MLPIPCLTRFDGAMALAGSSAPADSLKTSSRNLRRWNIQAVSQSLVSCPTWGLVAGAALLAMGLPVLVASMKRQLCEMSSSGVAHLGVVRELCVFMYFMLASSQEEGAVLAEKVF